MTVTSHSNEKETQTKSPEALRKEAQRAREESLGIQVFEIKLGPVERAWLAEGRKVRGGVRGSYDASEYLATLLRRDNALLVEQLGQLDGKSCGRCNQALPEGCGGRWIGDLQCWQTHAAREFEL